MLNIWVIIRELPETKGHLFISQYYLSFHPPVARSPDLFLLQK